MLIKVWFVFLTSWMLLIASVVWANNKAETVLGDFEKKVEEITNTQPPLQAIDEITALYRSTFFKNSEWAETGFCIARKYLNECNHKLDISSNPTMQQAFNFFHAKEQPISQEHDVNIERSLNVKPGYVGEMRVKYQAEHAVLRDMTKHGISFYGSEGYIFNKIDSNYLLETVLAGFEFDLKKYLARQHWEERNNSSPLLEDAALRCSWDKLRQNIIWREEFIKAHPNFIEREALAKELKFMFGIYIGGIDNSPVFEFSKPKIRSEAVQSYELFLKENKTSAYYPLVEKLFTLYKANGFKLTREIVGYLKQEGWQVAMLWQIGLTE